ncbi:hypothetical protein JCM10213v2_005595 [Rhodosporidiobolus nylandii]
MSNAPSDYTAAATSHAQQTALQSFAVTVPVTCAILGVFLSRCVRYFRLFPQDRRRYKGLVLTLLCLELIYAATSIATHYESITHAVHLDPYTPAISAATLVKSWTLAAITWVCEGYFVYLSIKVSLAALSLVLLLNTRAPQVTSNRAIQLGALLLWIIEFGAFLAWNVLNSITSKSTGYSQFVLWACGVWSLFGIASYTSIVLVYYLVLKREVHAAEDMLTRVCKGALETSGLLAVIQGPGAIGSLFRDNTDMQLVRSLPLFPASILKRFCRMGLVLASFYATISGVCVLWNLNYRAELRRPAHTSLHALPAAGQHGGRKSGGSGLLDGAAAAGVQVTMEQPEMDYFSFPSPRNEEVAGVADALLTPAEAAGYLSPLDTPAASPDIPSSLSSRLEEAASLSLSPLKEAPVAPAAKGSKRSPSALLTVLQQDASPPPPPRARFLHGGPPLSELEAPSVTMPSKVSSDWRAFTDEEEGRLQEGWKKMQEEKAHQGQSKEKGVVKGEGGLKRAAEDEADEEDAPYLVPVGLDNLFTVHLINHTLYPAFWTGTPVRVTLCHWFYAPPNNASTNQAGSLPSHHIKPYPVDPSLSASLDRAFAKIRPDAESYAAELSSALKGGAEAQRRLAVPLAVENEAELEGKNRDLGIEVIFEGQDRGRVYSRGMISSMSKSLWSSKEALGGGQVVLRGWDALRAYLREKAPKKAAATRPFEVAPSSASASASDSEGESAPSSRHNPSLPTTPKAARAVSPARRTRTDSTSSAAAAAEIKRSESPGFFSSLRSRIVGAPAPAEPEVAVASVSSAAAGLGDPAKLPNDTQTALERDPRAEDGSKIGVVDELVLIVHGVGQQLASSYDSFAFVHAANAFRSACTSLSTSETLSPLLRQRRAQFIPVLWRTDLDFDEVDDEDQTADEHLSNHFSLRDIEVQNSVPFLRQVVSGLVLDVPFYLSPEHKQKMLRSVVREANRIFKLFCKRNPEFSGKVSIIAHSLGSCLVADVLSSQPTSVKDLERKASARAKHDPALTFAFDTRVTFLVGSPLAFFLHLGKGQLIARAGRERTKNVGKDIALDRAGRYGCLATDAVYNVYNEHDPIVFTLNPTVDARYSKLIKPIPIPSTNVTLLQNLSNAYSRVSAMFDFSSLWSSAPQPSAEERQGQAEKLEQEKREKVDVAAAKAKAKAAPRPASMKRMPSERPKYGMGTSEHEWVSRAEKRMRALNPSGTCDFVLPAEGLNQYVDALYAHQGYWTDRRFCTFILSQLFSSDAQLEEAGREEVGIEEEDE